MLEAEQASRIVRFEKFELSLTAGELRKNGIRIRLQDQPFQVLAALLERPGKLVTRQALREKLWSGDTFVDFDRSLNTAIAKIREALGDSANEPRFVETLPRRGYRFIGPIERLDPTGQIVGLPAGAGTKGTISHYRLLRKLGEGGMGVVYKAEDTNLKRPVALKFLAAHLLGDEEIKARFRREAEAAAALNHPNVCHVYEISEVEGKTFIAMAFIEGEPLDKKIEAGPLKLEQALDIAIQTAKGLQAAHGKQVVHRDIKPENLMVGSDGLVTIMDFGLVLLTDRSKLTRLDETMGTVTHMSPEQTYGMELDHRTDIWALGVVIYEMVTGQQPFKGHYDKAVMYSITNEPPEPITGLRTGVPMELELLVDKCLAKDRDQRYQHTDELIVDLQSLSEKLKSGGSKILDPQTQRRETEPTTPPTAAGAVSKTRRGPGRKLRESWPVAAGLVLLAAAVVFWATQRGERRDAQKNWRVSRVTSTPEMEWDYSATPTSSLIAYSSPAAGNMDIYVMPVAGGTPLQLTDDPGDETQPSLSPDGNLIAFHSNRGGGTLYTVPVTGGTPRVLARTNDPSIFPPRLGLSPWRAKSGRQELLFTRTEADGRRAIWKIDLTSREETQLSRPEARERQTGASYSPDGEQIVFGQGGDLWTMPADGGPPRRMLQDKFSVNRASWTPDGSRLLFPSIRGGSENLWDLTIATGELRQITVGPGHDWGPILIPGKGLFYTQFSHCFNLFSVDLKSREHKALTAASDIEQMYPRFSPDGHFLAFDSNRGGDYEIFKLDVGSGETTPLTDNKVGDRYPDWAPTSDDLVFVSNRDGARSLWLMNAEGAQSRRLDVGPGAVRPRSSGQGKESGPPRWAPAGSVVGYLGLRDSGPELWSIQVDSGEARRLLSGVHSFDWYGDSGRVVVYNSTGGEQSVGAELRAVNLDTNEEVVLLEGLYANLDVAPDGSSVAYVTQNGHMSQQYFLLPLTPPGETGGLPRAAGAPEQLTNGGALWHTHAGSFSSDGSSFVYDRDLDEGDILVIENFE